MKTEDESGEQPGKFEKLVTLAYIDKELGKWFAGPCKVDALLDADFMHDTVVLRVVQEVYGRDLGTLEVDQPATWWDHFKQDRFPFWLRRRFPVRYTTDTYKASVLYPQVGKGPDGKLIWHHLNAPTYLECD